MPLKPCLVCGVPTPGPRCPAHQVKRAPRAPRADLLTTEWKKERARVLRDWRGTFGELCLGWGEPAHPVTPPNILTVDHVQSVAKTGTAAGALQVLCRRCNGRKGAR